MPARCPYPEKSGCSLLSASVLPRHRNEGVFQRNRPSTNAPLALSQSAKMPKAEFQLSQQRAEAEGATASTRTGSWVLERPWFWLSFLPCAGAPFLTWLCWPTYADPARRLRQAAQARRATMSHSCLKRGSTTVEKESTLLRNCSGGASTDHFFVWGVILDVSVWCELVFKDTLMGQVALSCRYLIIR